jgi:exopolysaccharide biosynthesis WecB/TagA/CpsF family protein
MLKKVKLFSTEYALTDYEQASDVIISKAKKHEPFSVFALPVHGVIEALTNKAMQEAVDKADMIVPDGQPIRWAINSIYKAGLKDRVYGPLLTKYVLLKANTEKLNVFLYGGASDEVLSKFSNYITTNYPHITITGAYREAGQASDDTVDIKTINDTNTHIVLVGKGCPLQEIWTAKHQKQISAVVMAVGAAFSFHAGMLKTAPLFMQKYGLEWFFRFIQEPRRLFKRYLFTNSYFIYLFLKYKIWDKKV